MKTIYKYLIDPNEPKIEVPIGAEPLAVQLQNGEPHLWCLVDTEAAMEERRIRVKGTGHDCDEVEGLRYLGTFIVEGDRLVFHTFW